MIDIDHVVSFVVALGIAAGNISGGMEIYGAESPTRRGTP